MSAFAAEAARLMICRSARSSFRSITARPSPDEKERFATLARARGLSESALALAAIRAVIATDSGSLDPYATSARRPATDRITIRLRPGDGEAIARRAVAARDEAVGLSRRPGARPRGREPTACPPESSRRSSRASASWQGSVPSSPRLPATPLWMALELEELRRKLSRTRAAVAALEQRTHDLARAALISWESRSD